MSNPRPGSAADIYHRVYQNVPGKFFVDEQCLDCDLCRETAPNNFSRDDDKGISYVSRQPSTPEELTLCIESVEGCPVDAIGDTGDLHDWSKLPPITPPRNAAKTPKQCDCETRQDTKPWWRFW